MIPHTLFIKNFLSYGSKGEHVSFDPYNLICLSGKNGHGKSALLDALTWAIWGHARKTLQSVKPDQGLLRLGQSQMVVIVEFSCNNQRYRIRREYMHHHNKPYAQLDFGLIEGEKLIPLTEKTIRATQETIINTIKLDYEGFCNTVFLRQGASNEFSKKSAKERKDLLAAILGLHTYEQVRKRALHKIKMAHSEHTYTTNTIQRLAREVSDYDNLNKRYNEQNNALAQVEKKIHAHHEKATKIEIEKKLFYEAEQLFQQYKNTYQQTTKNLLEKKDNLSSLYNSWRLEQKAQATLPPVDELLKQKTELLSIIDTQQKLYAKSLELKDLIIRAKQKKQDYEEEHKKQSSILERHYLNEITAIEKEIQENIFNQRALQNTITEQQVELTKIVAILNTEEENNSYYKNIQEIIKTKEKEIDRKKTVYQKIVAYGNVIADKQKELVLKIDATNDIHNPSCPLCEQNLSLARKRFLRAKVEKTYTVVAHQLKRITYILPLIKNRIISHHETLENLKKEELIYATKKENIEEMMRKKVLLEMHNIDALESLTQCTDRIDNLKKIVSEKKEQLVNLIPKLENNEEYRIIINNIQQLTQQSIECQYNKKVHTDATAEIETVCKTLALSENAQTITAQHNEMKKAIYNCISEIRTIKSQHNEQYLNMIEQKKIADTHSHVNATFTLWQQEQTTLSHTKEELIKTTTSLKHQLEQCTKIFNEIENLENNIKQCQQTIEDYHAIALATGKDGIQALLIEEAIPSIEYEANKLLAKLTHNNARIFIDSLKDLKNGGTKETLDIKIADNAGIRPYELFSGGESFRIDFALRIAVSTLLAQRAGTSLQTLIIDEGFGSQDEEGLNLINNTLLKIQDHFAKIIIVSHLPSMKDQFPVHFVIDKTNSGSTVKVVELG